MTSSEPEGQAPSGVSRIRTFLIARDRILCIAIVLAVVAPTVAVAAKVTPSTVGLPAARDFGMWDTQTLDSIRLSDYRGKVVFLDIMATWCVPCQESMPDLRTIHANYAGDSFVMLSVTGDPLDTLAKMEDYRTRYFANWTFGVPVDALQLRYDYLATGFPTVVIIDGAGLMTYRAVGRVPLATLIAHVEDTLNV